MSAEKQKEAWIVHGMSRRGSNKSDQYYNAYTAVEYPDKFQNLGEGACHGNFQGDLRKGCTVLHSWKMNNSFPVDPVDEKFFYTWLINESPWAKAFIEKDYEEVLKKGFTLDPKFPADYILSACVATRFLTESYNKWTKSHYETFKDLVNEKVDPLWAFVMAVMYKKVSGGYTYQMQNGHEVVPVHWTLPTLKRFVEGRYKNNTSFTERGGYSTIGTAWQEPGVSTNIRAVVWGDSKLKAEDLNIFRKPNGKYPLLSLKDLLFALDQVKEEVEKA